MLSKRRPTFNSQHKKINKDNQKDMCQYLYGMIQIFMHMLLTKEKDTWQKAPYVSYSIRIDYIFMRDMATFITGIIKKRNRSHK
jgi:anaerobic C4-dicarboxylate transporter